MQQSAREFAERVYPIYTSGDRDIFYEECLEETRLLNQGKMTKKQKIKAYSIINSLDVLADLDEDYCSYLVSHHLSKDEFIDLDKKTRILSI
jgi:hypothetical protein